MNIKNRVGRVIFLIGKVTGSGWLMNKGILFGHKSVEPSDEVKDAIIATYVKKGGCEVQDGCFIRHDCKRDIK